MYKLVALIGKSGSGKDTLKKSILKNTNWHNVIACTTRPMRENEQDGVEYHFISNEKFLTDVSKGDMLEASFFTTDLGEWAYGTRLSDLDPNKINIGIFNFSSIDMLKTCKEILIEPIYIDVTDKERLLRSLNRENNPNCNEICRRFFSDEHDFQKYYEDIDKMIWYDNNPNNNNLESYLGESIVRRFYDWSN